MICSDALRSLGEQIASHKAPEAARRIATAAQGR